MRRSTLALVPLGLALTLQPSVAPAQEAETARRIIEEVIVTATRREADIQDVPVAVTAISDFQMERAGFQDLRDLPTLSASFSMNSSQTESQGTVLRMRGVGTTGNNIGLESAVGVFMDGVFLSRPGIALGDMLDLRSIEVLRGPQGTLFGRNTSAGALVIRTKQPDLFEPEFWVNAGAGNFSSSNVQVGGSLPLVEGRLAARGSAAFRRQNGFLKSTTPGVESVDRDRISFRGQLLWDITDNVDLRIIADYADADEQCCDAPIVHESRITQQGFRPVGENGTVVGFEPVDSSFAAAGLSPDGGAPASGPSAFDDRISNAQQFENPFDQWGISAELNWNLGAADLIYIGSYREFSAESVQFSDFVGTDVFSVRPEVAGGQRTFDDIETTTHELRLEGESGRLEWMVGGFFMWEDIVEGQGLGLGADFTRAVSASTMFGGIYDLDGPTGDQVRAILPAFQGFDFPTGETLGDVLLAEDPVLALAGGVNPGVDATRGFAQNAFNQTTRSWSVFTHNTLEIIDGLDLVFGLRWVDEDKDGRFVQGFGQNQACENIIQNVGAWFDATAGGAFDALSGIFDAARGSVCFPFATPSVDFASPATLAATGAETQIPEEFDLNFSDEELVWTVKGVYRFTDLINGYVSFTHGFKSGGFNLDATAAMDGADPRFDSETVDAWEVGLKADFFDRRVRMNTALFYQEMDDFQVLEFTGVQFVTFNVPTAESKGVEVELQAAPIDQIDLGLSVTYQDASYPGDCADGLDPEGAAFATVAPLCGLRLTNAPDWTGVFSLSWDDVIPGTQLSYFAHTNLRWESKRRTSTQGLSARLDAFGGPEPAVADFQEAHAKVNVRLGLGAQDGRWSFEIWSNNVFDEQTTNNTFNIPLRGVNQLGTAARGRFIEAPRTTGATFRFRM